MRLVLEAVDQTKIEEAELEEAALEVSPQQSESGGGQAQSLGLGRWVQFAFIAAALVMFWLFDHLISTVWDFFAEPDTTLISVVSIVMAITLAVVGYRNAQMRSGAYNIAHELSRVTWPSREETWSATVVVVLTSIVAALILFVFDAAWSSLTDLIYDV